MSIEDLLLDTEAFLSFYEATQYVRTLRMALLTCRLRRHLLSEAVLFLLDVRYYKKLARFQRIVAEEEIVRRYFGESTLLLDVLPEKLVEELVVSVSENEKGRLGRFSRAFIYTQRYVSIFVFRWFDCV